MKDLVILSHLGMGDMIGIIPAIRFFCEKYNAVYIFCKQTNLNNVTTMYADLKNLTIISVEYNFDPSKEIEVINGIIQNNNLSECDILKAGIYKNSLNFSNLPDNFYMDLGLDLNVYNTHFKLPEDCLNDYSYLLEDKEFYFINGTSSTKNIDNEILSYIKSYSNTILINPNNNLYNKTDVNYDLANKFVGLPIFDYVTTIRKAKEIHIIDSAFSLLSKFVATKETKKYIYNRSGYSLSTNFFKDWEIR